MHAKLHLLSIKKQTNKQTNKNKYNAMREEESCKRT